MDWKARSRRAPARVSYLCRVCVRRSQIFALAAASVLTFIVAAHADAASWQLAASPGVGGLNAVSCTSSAFCMAVGFQADTSGTQTGPLAESWDGRTWELRSVPVAPKAQPVELWNVSCGSLRLCIAVGSGEHGPVAERWDGITWSPQELPRGVVPQDASCPTARFCLMVSSTGGMAARWNGRRWSRQRLPARVGALSAVSCPTSTWCLGVGPRAAAALWTDGGWSLPRARIPQQTSVDVSCSAPGTCTVIGDEYVNSENESAEVVRLAHGRWTVEVGASGAVLNYVHAISCPNASTRTMVGDGIIPGGSEALIERWQHGAWAAQPQPVPPSDSSQGPFLFGVSCPAASSCFAVGGDSGPASISPLIERYG
jgi:hypothetical protein